MGYSFIQPYLQSISDMPASSSHEVKREQGSGQVSYSLGSYTLVLLIIMMAEEGSDLGEQ